MKILQSGGSQADERLVRVIAFTFMAATVILALYFGRDILLPAAVAVLFAFILGPVVKWVGRQLPLPLAVAVVVLVALLIAGLLSAFVLAQLADVAGSLPSYQANLQEKIKDIRSMSEGGGALSRFMALMATLTDELALTTAPSSGPAVRLQTGGSSFESVAAFVMPLLHPVLTIGIVVVLVVFILLDHDHLSDQFVRLFGASDVHATSAALADAAGRIARLLALQLVMNFGFSLVVAGGLFALGMPNAALWGLLAGGLRFIPYIGTVLGAALPALIALAVSPGWMQPFLVLGLIVICDIILGQILEPLFFGESTGVTPLALIMSAIFWGALWGPIGLLLSAPLTICLLVLGRHVAHLGFLQVLLGHEPALAPHQQIYRRLIRDAVPDASAVALAEIERKGPSQGLDDSMGRMVVLAEADRALDRLSAAQITSIVEGTEDVLDFLVDATETEAPRGGAAEAPAAAKAVFVCLGGRGQIDTAAASIIAYALRRDGLEARSRSRIGEASAKDAAEEAALGIILICYASHPSEAVRRYTLRKLAGSRASRALHAVIDYGSAAAPTLSVPGPLDVLVGDIATIARWMTRHGVDVNRRDEIGAETAARPARQAVTSR